MPQLPNQELEERLGAACKSLVQPPSSLDELLLLLDRTEDFLSKVEQSPVQSMQTVLNPLMKALVSEKLLKHSDADVKVGVASCISEITRITAPEAPYDDERMKDVFQLIVSSLGDISDTSSRSHKKRATILETVAKVRSCVIMLDLECDQMIIEMFQHFLKSIRDYHGEVIFASMETIMTLILEESEEISPDILNPILSTLKKNNKTVLPIAKKLAEKVVRGCAAKLSPYLPQALQTLDASLEDYSEVLASVCRKNNGVGVHSNENILRDQSVVKEITEETSPQDKDLGVHRSPKTTATNGVNETGTEEIVVDANFSKKAVSENASDANLVSKIESGDLGVEEPAKLEAKVDQVAIRKGNQFNSENDSAELSDVRDSKKLPDKVPSSQENTGEDIPNSPNEVPPVESATTLDNVKDTSIQLSPSEAHENEDVNVETPKQHGSLPERNQIKRSARTKRKGNLIKKGTVSIDTASKKVSDGENTSGAKKQQHSGKKQSAKKVKDNPLVEEGESKNAGGNANDSDTKSLDQTEKLKASDEENISGLKKQLRSGKKQPAKKAKKGSSCIEEVESKDEVESKNDGNKASDSEINSLDQKEKVKASDEENISGSKKQQRSGKKQPAKNAKRGSFLIEEVESKNDGGNASDSEMNSLDQTEKLKLSDEEPISRAKKQRHTGKKQSASAKKAKDITLVEESDVKKDGGNTSDSEAKSTEKLKDSIKRADNSSQPRKDGKKSGGAKPRSEKDVSESSARLDDGDDMVTSPRSPLQSTKYESNNEETPRMSNKRKRTPGTEKASGTVEYGEDLVGSKVKVWWPKDRAFYEGTVQSFDSVKKKHKVLYADGDEEVLNLKRERWEFIGDGPVSDGGKAVEHLRDDAPSDVKKKKGMNSETSSKHVKVESSDKSKSKDTATKSAGKSKDDDRIKPKIKDNSKSSGKSEDETIKSKDRSAKASGKSKDVDVAKTPSHLKQETQNTAKSKDKTPSGKTLGTSGSGMTKSGSSMVKETDKVKKYKEMDSTKSPEIVKLKSQDTPKSRESDSKSAKKRKR